ncbi:MAG: hypothetical protein HOW97_25515 [Catenulispora sp.]|nr:hypothetical protein [Catenulispora sp.]
MSVVSAPAAAASAPTPSPTPAPTPSATSRLVSASALAPGVHTQSAIGKATPPPPISPAGAVDPGPTSTVSVGSGPSPALAAIDPLPAVAPAPGAVTVPTAPFVPQPGVTPSPIVLPTHPASDLVDATTADATATLRAAGRLNADGTPNLDANALQPQMPSAKFIDPAHPATLQDLINALTSGDLPPPLPVDPLALLQALPDGIPRITYRVCSESDTKAASCSLTLPLAVPAIVDVTGDHTPDVLMDMVPVAAPGDVIAAATQLLDVQKQITDAQNSLNGILQILQDPLQAILHPELLVEKLRLQQLLTDLADTLAQKLQALTDLIDLGVAVLEVRLPTSETTGKALHAHVWGVYDLPTHKRLSVGFDGFRRGDTLPVAALGLYTFNVGRFLQGVYDIHANVLQVGAGAAMAITAGLGTVSDDAAGDVVDPTVASARFSPVPLLFSAHAVIDPGSATAPQTASIDATSTSSSHLDAQVLSDGAASDSFTQAKIDTLPTQVSAQVTRPQGTPDATVRYTASSAIDNVLFADFEYAGSQLSKATQAVATKLPSAFDATLQAASAQAANSDNIAFHYSASSALAALDADYYDRQGGMVGRGSLRRLPTAVDLVVDRPASHLSLTASQAIGSAALNVSRNLGAYAPILGDHATLVTNGTGVGISAQVSGLKSVDAYYDSHPRLSAQFDPGGQPFEAAADLDGDQKARATVSNLPPTLSVDADTASGKIAYRAGAVVHRVQVEYTKVSAGPTLFAAVDELPQSVDVSYTLGDKPEVTYQASSSVPRIEVFASKDHIETLHADADHYISALLTDLPTKADYALDIPNHHLEGTSDQPFGGIDVVARLPIQGRDWTGDGKLTGIPAHFDADFGGGTMRMRGLSGPLGSAAFTVTNHAGAVEPTGLHLAAHYRQSSGDLDGGVAVRNLTTVEYAHTATDQTATLQMDTGADPVFIDADVLLGADDTRIAATGRVTDLPTKLTITSSDGKLTYSADKHIGIQLEVHLGKVAAINATAVPLFPKGVSAMAAACSGGAGCASDSSPFCTVFAGHCFGLSAILNLPGLPTSVVVDTKARTVAVTGYAPPASALQAYVRLSGLIDSLPDVRALATLSGLPSPVDFTVGPMDFNGSSVDAKYTASAPLGTLTLDGQATTTNAQFPELRARVSAGKLPASFHLTGQFGQSTSVHLDDSAAVDSIGVTVTSPSTGYLDGSITGVPASADVTADLAAQHIEATMSAPISGVHLLAHVPYQGRTWSAYLNVLGIPGKFDVDYAGGSFRFRGLSGPLHQAAAAITNNGGATAPSGPHLAVHYRQSTGDLDASARIDDLTSVQYAHSDHDFTVTADVASQTVALDGDVVLAAGGKDDVKLTAAGRLGPIPSTFTVGSANGVITYSADRSLDLTAQLWVGKIAALDGLGVHEFANGISVADAACGLGGAGCADGGPFAVNGKGIGAVGIINVSGLPSKVTVDPSKNTYGFSGYQPKVDRLDLYVADTAFVPAPLTGAKVWATLEKLPTALDFTLGPLNTGTTTHLGWSSNVASAGKLTVRAEAFNVPLFDDARALAVLSPIPGSLSVDGTFGKDSDVKVDDSVPIDELSLTGTGTFQNDPASGMVAFTGIPKSMEFKGGGFQSGDGQKVPTVSYGGSDDTLSGTFHVEAKLAEKLGQAAAGLSDAYLSFSKMGRSFTITYDAGSKTAQVQSNPTTAQVMMGVAVFFTGDLNYTFDGGKHLFDVSPGGVPLLYGTMEGHANVHSSTLGLMVTMNNIDKLSLKPGQKNSGLPLGIELPDWFGYLFLGVQGTYGSVDIQDYNVDLNPDVDATFRVQRTFSPVDLFSTNLKLGHASSLYFHRYMPSKTSTEKFDLEVAGAAFGCLTLSTKPGIAEVVPDGVELNGSDGAQMVSFLDPSGQVDPSILDMFAYATSSIGGMSFDDDFSAGGC